MCVPGAPLSDPCDPLPSNARPPLVEPARRRADERDEDEAADDDERDEDEGGNAEEDGDCADDGTGLEEEGAGEPPGGVPGRPRPSELGSPG